MPWYSDIATVSIGPTLRTTCGGCRRVRMLRGGSGCFLGTRRACVGHFAVERFHWAGHTGDHCAKYCDPYKVEGIKKMKTVVCEQKSKCVSKHKQ